MACGLLNGRSDPAHRGFFALQSVLPETKHLPARCPQSSGHELVAALVSSKLRQPVCLVRGGDVSVFWAAVPEASINENGHLGLSEYEIRPPKHRLMPPPTRQTMFAQDGNHPQLCPSVPLTFDPGHHSRPPRLRKPISHGRGGTREAIGIGRIIGLSQEFVSTMDNPSPAWWQALVGVAVAPGRLPLASKPLEERQLILPRF